MDESQLQKKSALRQMQRISVVGTTGSGKSTLAKAIARKLEMPCVELDAINWQENWTETPHPEFAKRVAEEVSEKRWVIEGGYSRVRSLIWDRADTVIWLDYPLPTVFWRLLSRTIRRNVRREILWSGNQESFVRTFSSDSIIVWLFRSYWRRKKQFTELLMRPENQHLTVLHFQLPKQTDDWVKSL